MKKNNITKFFSNSSTSPCILNISLGLFLLASFFLRVGLVFWQKSDIFLAQINFLQIIKEIFLVFSVGLFFDILAFCYLIFGFFLIYSFIPTKIINKKPFQFVVKCYYFLMIFTILFSFFSEIIFWDEFQARFNFIAVDYLIYTTEVINNIVESYPVFWLMGAILLTSFIIFYAVSRKFLFLENASPQSRFAKLLFIFFILLPAFFLVDSQKTSQKISANKYLQEISTNGIYQLFSAYRNNQIDFLQLYSNIDYEKSLQIVRNKIAKQEPKSKFLSNNNIDRLISKRNENEGAKKYNIIVIIAESFSADFMKYFGNEENLTPNLDKIANQSLFFTNLKATGTRTVRGLEAISLGVPPTPGNSIVRRQNNDNLFNIASPLLKIGYEAKFIYGGNGYFDNMNSFFAKNNFTTIDKNNFASDEISFSNAWGVADEDLYNKTLKEADSSFGGGKNFINLVLTTSNHRPFTYPNGKIDIPSGKNRSGAVKYSDYAFGKFIEDAKKKEWFNNTIFVFVADHCAGSAGNTNVPVWRYQIPAIFYAPKIIKPQIFDKNISQIDIAPTLLGFLNFNYQSKFFGLDMLKNSSILDSSAFISTYTDLGYLKNNYLFLLSPKKQQKIFEVKINKFGYQGSQESLVKIENLPPDIQKQLKEENIEAIAYYQLASQFFAENKLKNFDFRK